MILLEKELADVEQALNGFLSAIAAGIVTKSTKERMLSLEAQKEELEKFNGPILMTTNCIVPPKESYKDRLYTTGATGYPGCKHITGGYGEKKDFSRIIEHAKKCPPPTEIEQGEIY